MNSEVADPNDDHDFGTDWLADVIRNTGAHYRDHYLNSHPTTASIDINDASKPKGGHTPDHAGHEAGLSCDFRLPKKNGQTGGITWQSAEYDQVAMRAVLQSFGQSALVHNSV